MKSKEVILRVIILVLLVSPLVYAGYEEQIREGIFLVRPDNEFVPDTSVPIYLDDEDLIFFACLEAENVPLRLSVLCLDNNDFQDITAYKWGADNCYLGTMNLEDFECGLAQVQADYVEDNENLKLTQQIKINKFAKSLNRIIQTQFSDGGWETPLDTAYGLLVISYFPDIFPQRIENAIEYLKLNRHEKDKCWPEDQCKVSHTSNILFLLEKAGFEDLRIQHDGMLYLEKVQNYIPSSTTWTVNIIDHTLNLNNTVNTSCVFDYGSTLSNFSIPKNPTEYIINITAAYNTHVGAVCTENIFLNIYNEFSELVIAYQGDNFSYTTLPACWSLNNENKQCDIRTTAFSVNTEISKSQATAGKSYLSTLEIEDRTAGKHIRTNWNTINDALYLHTEPSSSDDFETALLFQQYNDGSWKVNATYYEHSYFEVSNEELSRLEAEITDNISREIVATGYVVMSLLENSFDREDEVIIDAERWISENEDETSLNFTDEDLTDDDEVQAYKVNRSYILNDTKRNSMGFYVLQHNARPILLAKPRTVIMNENSVELDVINPTIFELEELTYEFSSDIDSYLTVEDKDYVDAYSFRRVTISKTKDTPVDDIGYLRILKGSNEYLKVPIILQSSPTLNITLPEQLTVFGGNAILPFKIMKSTHNFTCSLEWESPGISSTSQFDISNAESTYNYPVKFATVETENTVYDGTISCSAIGVTFNIPFATNIIRFSTKPIDVFPQIITINSSEQQQWVTIRNLLDESIDVVVEPSTLDPYIVLSDPFVNLFPGEARNITVQVIPPQGENYTTSNSLIFTTFNVEERILLNSEIIFDDSRLLPLWLWITIWVLVLGLISAITWWVYTHKDKAMQFYYSIFKRENIKAEIFKKIRETEKEEEMTAIRNMIRILKMQGLGDADVRKSLKNEGYTNENVNEALNYQEKKEEEKKPEEKK